MQLPGEHDDAELARAGVALERAARHASKPTYDQPADSGVTGPRTTRLMAASTCWRCACRARSYSARAARTDSSDATSATGTSHQLS